MSGVGRGILYSYRELLSGGVLRRDINQLLLVEKLQALHNGLRGYRAGGGIGWRERLGLGRRLSDVPMGLYIYGGAGGGKSMLMDLFFSGVDLEFKRRVHFHEFMLEVHGLLGSLRESVGGDDVIVLAARDISERVSLLCFDEFHVSNISDAMVLGRLFEHLLLCGVVIVVTSNVSPDDLYGGGLQRERFLPFIELLKSRFDILHLHGEDYRLARIRSERLYFDSSDSDEVVVFGEVFEELSGRVVGESCEVSVGSRSIYVPEYVGMICRFGFVDLCGVALGSRDYLALADCFRIFFISGVPVFGDDLRNELKRFIVLVDILYERRALLSMSVVGGAGGLVDLCCSVHHGFEYGRTYSRLEEMCSRGYCDEVLAEYNKNL